MHIVFYDITAAMVSRFVDIFFKSDDTQRAGEIMRRTNLISAHHSQHREDVLRPSLYFL